MLSKGTPERAEKFNKRWSNRVRLSVVGVGFP